eukprot:g28969.t2
MVMAVHDHPEAGCIIVGRVETGSIRSGLKVIFAPGGLVGEVKSVFRGGKKISEASGGDVVSVNLGGVDPSQLRRGMVASTSSDAAADAETFLAQDRERAPRPTGCDVKPRPTEVVVFDHPGQIRTGYCPAITVHTSQVPCEFEELLSKVDRKTGNDSETHPASAKSGEVIKVKMRPRSLVCVEPFSAYPK